MSATVGEASSFDVSTTKTDGTTTVTPGSSTTYTITVSNSGPGAAAGTVVDTLPPELINASWTCVGAGGGVCSASGSGGINDSVSLPAGGSVTYTLTATVGLTADGAQVTNTASFSGLGDVNQSNDSASDIDTVLCISPNRQPADVTANGVSNGSECDTDGDGLPDPKEKEIGTDPQDPDTDDDGLPDGKEWGYKQTYTCLNLFRKDSDGEGIGDGFELGGQMNVAQSYTANSGPPGTRVLIGKVRTNPCKQDTDGDGLTDWREVVGSSINQQVIRFAKDGGTYLLTSRKTNPLDRDTDDDSLTDKLEITGGANWRFDHRRSDPTTADTDWGGGKDGREVIYRHTDPTWAGH